MEYKSIQLDRAGQVAVIRLNDPDRLNAMSTGMVEEIGHALGAIAGSARALLLAANGRAFCAGADLQADPPIGDDGLVDMGLTLETHVNPLLNRLRSLPIPWIAAVHGAAAGVGCSLALSADLIVAGQGAFFLQAFSRVGLVPDGGASWLLNRSLGRARSMELALLGERLPATKALEWGLINRVVADGSLQDAALDIARALAAGPTRSLAMIRAAIWSAADQDWNTALATERGLQREAGRTEDYREGVRAFVAKRPARFTGH